ncbi:MAG: hypothetical protein PHX80_05255 [Candidatus Nanoarchaeia archaeon]|nr:hypothetical protein [Candidatus Nanoarchaeia archaeon]
MKTLKEMTIEELTQLINDAKNEITLRESAGNGFYKEFSTGAKAYKGATYKQIKYAESLASKTDSKIEPTTSQLMKYFDIEEMGEAIDLMQEGKRIRIS